MAEPVPRRDLRIGHAERDAAVEQLKAACADGRLTSEEFAQRLDAAYAARTAADLEPIVRDLPGGSGIRPLRPSGPAVAVFGADSRRGDWIPATRQPALAVFGSVRLDLREARIPLTVQEIRAYAVFGSVEIVVPEGVHVELDVVAVAGERSVKVPQPPHPSAPTIRVTGATAFGSIRVRTRRPRRSRFR